LAHPSVTIDIPVAEDWMDWKWQQRNAIRSVEKLVEFFPGLSSGVCERIRQNAKRRRVQITPYALSMIQRSPDGDRPADGDPLWKQFIPFWPEEEESSNYAYDGHTENWEMPEEMVTPIAQHKYDNRVIVRVANVCHAYCQFCYEALRTLEKDSVKLSFQEQHWKDTVEYVRKTSSIEEVILSGGEPLMLQDEQVERLLSDLNSIGRPLIKRIHTRALTFNPFRVTPALTEIFARQKLASLGLHVTHPNELTPEFLDAVDRLHAVVPILFANMPLLRGVNDSVEMMHELGIKLYSCGVIPHYLYHFMPYSPGSVEFRTSVQNGIDIVRSLKRRISNLAVPEFVMPHHTGKYSPPLLHIHEVPPHRTIDRAGHPVVRFENWIGHTVDYPDVRTESVDGAVAIEQAHNARAVLEVDLDAIAHNLDLVRQFSGTSKVMAVLKGNAYGLGAVPIARLLEAHGVEAFATDNIAEGVELRAQGISRPIMIIDGDVPENVALAMEFNLTPGIADTEQLRAYQDSAAAVSRRHPVWLVANVGFNRYGYRDLSRFSQFVAEAGACPNLEVQGVYAHLTNADSDSEINLAQIAEYELFLEKARAILGPQLASSLFASHGLVRWGRQFQMDWVRPGLVLFGEHMFDQTVEAETLERVRQLRPAIRLRARITHLVDFARADGVGYGQRLQALPGQRLATVAFGFGSGYPLRGNGLPALVDGKPAALFGDSGMDSLQIDVTGIDAKLYNWITLAGTDGDQRQPFSLLAQRAGTNVYQLISGLRCRRIYLKKDKDQVIQ
jgi:lysine 2,3-aminomutase